MDSEQLAGHAEDVTTPQNGADNDQRGIVRALFWADLQTLPRPQYQVKGVWAEGDLVEVYGPTGSAKTFFAIDIALHVGLGWNWRGRRVRQGGVLYISAEGGRGIIRRLEAFQRERGVSLDGVPFAVVMDPLDMRDPQTVGAVITEAARVPNLRLIVVDTASRAMPGSKEDTEDMGLFVSACDRIRQETKATLVAVHHTGKDSSRGSRGSIVLPAAADTMIEISRDASTKISTAENVKQRDGETGEKFAFTLKLVDLGTDDDGDMIRSCVCEVADAAETTGTVGGQAGIALQLLRNAIIDEGQPAPASKHIPDRVKSGTNLVVPLTLWRDYCYAGLLTERDNDRDKKDSQRRAFNRASKTLQSRRIIGVWDGWVWIVE